MGLILVGGEIGFWYFRWKLDNRCKRLVKILGLFKDFNTGEIRYWSKRQIWIKSCCIKNFSFFNLAILLWHQYNFPYYFCMQWSSLKATCSWHVSKTSYGLCALLLHKYNMMPKQLCLQKYLSQRSSNLGLFSSMCVQSLMSNIFYKYTVLKLHGSFAISFSEFFIGSGIFFFFFFFSFFSLGPTISSWLAYPLWDIFFINSFRGFSSMDEEFKNPFEVWFLCRDVVLVPGPNASVLNQQFLASHLLWR